MPPPPPPDVREPVSPLPDEPASPPERFASCSRVLFAPPETGPGERTPAGALEEIPYRRCPVGLIASLDCPELVGVRCLHHDPRGDRPRAVVPRSEVASLARELADGGYLTEAYRRRLRGLRVAVPGPRPLSAFVPAPDPRADAGSVAPPVPGAPSRHGTPTAEERTRVLVNVPSDDARRRPGARRRGGDGAAAEEVP